MLFLSKDPRLSTNLIKGLLRYWPFANSLKETNFVSELQEVLEVSDNSKLEPMIKPLFKRIVKCISGSHLQVADRAMCFFENECFLSLLKQFKEVTFPMLVPVINEMAEKHWHNVLQESLVALKSILSEIDPAAYEKALSVADREKQLRSQKKTPNREAQWDKF